MHTAFKYLYATCHSSTKLNVHRNIQLEFARFFVTCAYFCVAISLQTLQIHLNFLSLLDFLRVSLFWIFVHLLCTYMLYNVLNGICLWILWVCSRWWKKGGKERDEQLMLYLFFAAINYAANQNIRLAQCAQNCSVVIVMSMATVYLRSCRVRIFFLFLMKERNGSSTYRVHNIKWYLLEQISLVQCTLTWTQW